MPLLLAILSTIIITGSLFYYIYALTNGVIFFILAIVLALLVLFVRRSGAVLSRGVADGSRHGSAEGGERPRQAVSGHAGVANEAREDAPERLTQKIIQYLLFLIPLALAFYTLFTHQTTQALRSPWEVIPPYFFLLYGVVVLVVLHMSRSGVVLSHGVALFIITFLTLSVSLIIFPLGVGFDPFIHQATEKIIAATGTITPKPLYYIGQYTLVVFLSKILGISVVWIDKLLVPLLASIFIPWSIKNWWDRSGAAARSGDASRATQGRDQKSFAEGEQSAKWGGLLRVPLLGVERGAPAGGGQSFTVVSFLLLPFLLTPFTTTTPYSLALLFLAVLIFNNFAFSIQFLLALATILIHPLVGIPAFLFLATKYIQIKNYLLRITYYALLSFAIPVAFLISSQLSSQIHITFAPQNFLPWLRSLSWSGIYRENRFNAPLDLLYFYGFNIKNIFWFFALSALFKIVRDKWRSGGLLLNWLQRGVTRGGGPPSSPSNEVMRSDGGKAGQDPERSAPEWRQKSYLFTFLILLASYVLMSGFLSFNFLIGYEQADYAKRVLDVAYFFLIPFFLLGIHWWIAKIPRPITIILLTLAIPTSLFLTYPQKVDSYSVSHAFNTSQSDIDAVLWIDADARGGDYIVLANQAVSAAAIRELGFKKYYNDIFFYPIPTGSPLYKFYLKMVYEKASTETLREAIQLVGAERGYFVLNRYWNDFDRIFNEANTNLQLLHSINNSVFIFVQK